MCFAHWLIDNSETRQENNGWFETNVLPKGFQTLAFTDASFFLISSRFSDQTSQLTNIMHLLSHGSTRWSYEMYRERQINNSYDKFSYFFSMIRLKIYRFPSLTFELTSTLLFSKLVK